MRTFYLAALLAVSPPAAANDGNDIFEGGPGIDTVDYSKARQPVSVDLSVGTAFGHDIGDDTLRNIENIIGGRGHDRIAGDANDNVLDGGPSGSDFIDGGNGLDTAVFRRGRANYQISRVSTRSIEVAAGGNVVTLQNIEALKFEDETILIENIVFD